MNLSVQQIMKMGAALSSRTFGVELEVVNATRKQAADAISAAGIECEAIRYNHETSTSWKATTDGSLEGTNRYRDNTCEVVSPILCGMQGLLEVFRVCEALASIGAKVNSSCGFHVHHAAEDFNVRDWRNLCCQYVKHEGILDRLQPSDRREDRNYYCRGFRPRFEMTTTYTNTLDLVTAGVNVIRKAETLRELNKLITGDETFYHNSQARYRKLNLCAFLRHKTVEFRHHAGTVDGTEAVMWVLLTQGLVEDARKRQFVNTVDGCDAPKTLFACVPVPVRSLVRNFYSAKIAA